MTEYAPKGLIGVLTPQANTTVEPELSILCPPGYALATARLTSEKASMDDRLVDYVGKLEKTLDRFANMPLGVALFACTGASYLVTPEEERATLEKIKEERGYELITAADAVAEALGMLGAERVGIISPYGDPLHNHALTYWTGRGIGIAGVTRIKSKDAAFHPIYALGADASQDQLRKLMTSDLDAVVILGTGLPSLSTILAGKGMSMPVISPNLCLMWSAMARLGGNVDSADSLTPWLDGSAWHERFKLRVEG